MFFSVAAVRFTDVCISCESTIRYPRLMGPPALPVAPRYSAWSRSLTCMYHFHMFPEDLPETARVTSICGIYFPLLFIGEQVPANGSMYNYQDSKSGSTNVLHEHSPGQKGRECEQKHSK